MPRRLLHIREQSQRSLGHSGRSITHFTPLTLLAYTERVALASHSKLCKSDLIFLAGLAFPSENRLYFFI